MRRPARLFVFVALVLAGGIAGADEPPKAPPAAPAPKPAPPPTPEQAADAALAAAESKDEPALKALAAKNAPDPWLVADELMRRREFDAAVAFSKAALRPDVEALPGYVEARRARGPDDGPRNLLAAMNAAVTSGDSQTILEGTGALAPEMDAFFRIRLLHVRSSALWKLERWRDCAVASHGAADAAAALGWLSRAWTLYDRAVLASFNGSDGTQALASLEGRLRIDERGDDKRDAARSYNQIGIAQMRMGDPAKAGPAFDQALARYEALQDTAGIAWVLTHAAELYQRLGDHGKAIAAFARALPLADALGNREQAAEAVNSLGNAYLDLGDHPRALAAYLDALARGEALGEKARMAGVRINLGNAYRQLGDRARAMSHYEVGRALAVEVERRDWLRNAMVGIAQLHTDSAEHAKALAMYQQLLAMQEGWGDKSGAALTVKMLGDVYFARGDLAKAVSTYEQALTRAEAVREKAGIAATLQALGLAYLGLGDYARALSVLEQALARWQALGDEAGAAGTLVNLGNTVLELGDSAGALAHYQRALALAEKAGHQHWRMNAMLNIANRYRDAGDPKRAIVMYERAFAEYEAQRLSGDATKTLVNTAKAYIALKDDAKALELFLKALARSEAASDGVMIALGCIDIGCLYDNMGDVEKGRAFLQRAERVARSRRLARLHVSALTELVVLHMDHGETALALRDAREALGEMEKLLGGLGEEQGATARTQHVGLFANGTLAAVREKDLAAALTFLESGRAGALLDDLDKREALRWKAEALPPELQRLDAEAQAKEHAARETYEKAGRRDDLRAQQEASKALDEAAQGVGEVTGRIQRELKLQAAFFYPRVRAIEDIRSALAADQALVLYGLCQDEALALVVRAGGERVVPLGKAADVVGACQALDAKDPGIDPKSALDALRKHLVEPLALEDGVKQVLVSPEGPLCYLPFSALFGPTVAMTPSGTTHVLLLDEQGEPGRGILALGDPDYAGVSEGAKAIYQRGHPLTALPATRAEAASIGTRTLLGADASEANLHAVLPSSPRWRAIHFACHGLVNIEKPLLSSLALTRAGDADGFFTALEVLRTKVSADLVVLSACETATGKIVNGEGIVGLARAFMFAGTPRVICSLWKVDDEATAALMTRFYELWNPKDGTSGLPTAEALRKAQEFVRSQEKWKHPYYWAAWVLWGLPS